MPSRKNGNLEQQPRDRLGRPLPKGIPSELVRSREVEQLGSNREALALASELFDAARFFEAHEVFEWLWNSTETSEADRGFWKGATQLAAAYCQVQREHFQGALTLIQRATSLLDGYPRQHLGVDTDALEQAARRVASTLRSGTLLTALPRWPQVPTERASEERPGGV